jgi:hypothetical protein
VTLSSPALAENCQTFMPDIAVIQGVLSLETLPGEPNHKSIEDADTPETYYFLTLEPPICIVPRADSMANKPVSSISKIQLTFRGEAEAMHEKLKPHAGAGVRCAGYLYTWHMPRHHTQVLMMTQECSPVAAESP